VGRAQQLITKRTDQYRSKAMKYITLKHQKASKEGVSAGTKLSHRLWQYKTEVTAVPLNYDMLDTNQESK
jgi:hypothetical protein